MEKKDEKGNNLFDSLNTKEKANVTDLLFEDLLKMAIKRDNHDDVTTFFLEFITRFPLQFVYEDEKDQEEKLIIYSNRNREKLFAKIKMMDNHKFYQYMFNKENISLIHSDLLKIHMENSSKD